MQKISAQGGGFILDNMRIDRSGEHVVQSLANGAWGGEVHSLNLPQLVVVVDVEDNHG